MNISLAIFSLSYIRAHAAVFIASMPSAEPAAPAPRRLRPSRQTLKRRAAGAGARRIDAGAGIVSQARGN
jgi:hypothetical protein